MSDHRRYQPYYRSKFQKDRRYGDDENDDYRRHYKKSNSHHHYNNNNHHHHHPSYSSSNFRRDERSNYNNYRDTNYRYWNKNDNRYSHSQTKFRHHSSCSTPPPPILSLSAPATEPTTTMMTTTAMTTTTTTNTKKANVTPAAASTQVIVPQERESWVRSVKKTSINESTEQKTQYLETILRMPQQKTTVNASKFDRMRFAKEPSETEKTSNSSENAASSAVDCHELTNSSFHLISDIEAHDDIQTIENIFSDKEKIVENNVSRTTKSKEFNKENDESNKETGPSCSGFLIDDCDEEEFDPGSSPPPIDFHCRETNESTFTTSEVGTTLLSEEDMNERRVLLVHELDKADAERRRELRRQKRLQQSLQSKKLAIQQTKSRFETNGAQRDESPNELLIDSNAEQTGTIDRLKEEFQNASFSMSDEEKTNKVNLILTRIKKQQDELKKLKQYVVSILGDQTKERSRKSSRTSKTKISEDLLMEILNQPSSTGCWLCSGKMYSEASTQCDFVDKK